MRNRMVAQIAVCAGLAICAVSPACAENTDVPADVRIGTIPDAPSVPSRVVDRVDDARLVSLPGNTHFLARPKFDQGAVDPQLPMERMVLVLKRSPEQEAALEAFMAGQYDPKSPNFHHWLTPEEFGNLYGPNDSDIAAVTNWLQNHGFQIYLVNKGRTSIEFSGTAAQVQQTLHTEMHNYLVNGKAHIANDRDPQIPSALAPVVAGVASLHDFFPMHQSILGQYVRRDKSTGVSTPFDSAESGPRPEYAFPDQYGNHAEDVSPYDFATIYNLTPLWNAGITGKGQTIAISAVTDIVASDVSFFRSTFGLGSFTGTVTQVHNGTDPGIVKGAQVENTLDTEWSGAAAPDANVAVVVSASTATTFGGILSDTYIVNNPSLATIMSASYGSCEIAIGTAGNSAINAIYQQGSAEGISMFESAGDQGSAGCDNSDATTFPNPAQYGLNVNGDASSPYITAVGGTDLAWENRRLTFWNDTNNANGSSALGYIPEIPWNSTCASEFLLTALFTPIYGYTSTEEDCNKVTSLDSSNLITVTGGSGGVSSCTTSTGGEFSTCSGGYAKPSWQAGVGVPADGKRDVPDVSLFASDGYPDGINGSAYLICVASNSPTGTCDYTSATDIVAEEVGGTSVSSPAMAGIMALVQQKQGKAQGLANPVFYALAAKDNLTNCNSNTVVAGNTCNFYDITSSTNAQPCTTGSRNCVTNTSGDTYGILSGYSAGTGYDEATGLGSVNATNLVNNWSSVTGTPAVSFSPTSLTFGSATVGSATPAQVVTLKNTGSSTLTLTSETLTGTGASSFLISANTCTTSLAAGASCAVSVEFKPGSAGSLSASLSVADNATGSPQTVALSGIGSAPETLTITLSPTTLTFASTTVGSTTAAQVVTVKNTGTGAATLTSETLTGTGAASFLISANTCTTSLAAGASCTVSVEFKPASAAAFSASLSVADNASGSPQTVALSGTGTPPVTGGTLSVTPASLSFASTAVGSATAPLQVIVKNTGTTTVTFTGFTYTGANTSSFVESGINCGTTLAAGATCAVAIEFKPQSAGALTATLNIADNATGSPQTVALSGTGTGTGGGGTLSVTPASLAFASTNVGSVTAAQQVIVKNTGTTTVTFTGFTYTGANTSSFVQSGINCGTTLAEGASCAVAIEFKPAAAGALTASLSIADNATGSPQTVSLSGTGTTTTGGGTLTITPASLSLTYASTAVGSVTAPQQVIVKNTGTTTVTFTGFTYTGANTTSFVQSGINCGTTLAAGAACAVAIEFKPQSSGALTATLNIADNATGSPQKVTLTGTGTGGTAATVTLSPTSLAFPNTIVGSTSDAQVVTLTNTGSVSVTVSSITLAGASPSSYLDLSNCGATLAASASCSIYVAFKPASAAALSATLSVADTATGSPQTVALTGTGTAAPSVKLSATSLAFGTVAHGTTSAAQMLTLTNSGTATLTLSSITLTGTGAADFEALNTCAATLAPSASCTVYVAFKPAAAAAYTATLSIADNGSASPQSVALSGTGD